jgi:hypothetical protein
MLEQLLIQNFQAHGKLRIDFDPGITCIVGPSDVGKSAIVRALRWVCMNQPGGDAFVRYGTKGATVKLTVDRHTITRRRSSGGDVNEYRLDDQEFKAFGRGVPEPIEQFLNLTPVCWQGQHDAPYWFADTAGEVSRQLNAIVDLSIIDDTLAGVAKAVYRARTRLEMAEEELTAAKATYDDLAWVPKFEAAIVVVENAEAAYTKLAATANGVTRGVQAARLHQAAYERATDAARCGQAVIDAGSEVLHLQRQVEGLNQLVVRIRVLTERLDISVPTTQPMEDALTTYQTSAKRGAALQVLLDSIQVKGAELCQAEEELRIAEKAVPKRCPLCGQSL